MDKVTFLKFLNGNDTIERLNDLYKFRNAKSIGMQSLNNMSKLKSINIPPNIQGELGLSVCQYNTVMEEAIISSNQITTLGNAAFSTNKLTSFVIPNSVTSLIEYVCYNCSLLEKLVLGKEIKNIHSGCFTYANLKDIYVDSLKHWFNITFSQAHLTTSSTLYLGQIEAVRDPEKGNQIDHYKWDKLEQERVKVTLPMVNEALKEVTKIKVYACANMTQLEGELVIPNNITSIGNNAFSGCTGITSITIPNSVTSIGESAFRDCVGLINVSFSNTITSILDAMFNGCSNLTGVNAENSVYLPNVEVIGSWAFTDCKKITTVYLGENIRDIQTYAFMRCSSLTNLIVRNTQPPTMTSNALNFTNSKLIIYVPDASLEKYKTANSWNAYADRIKPFSEIKGLNLLPRSGNVVKVTKLKATYDLIEITPEYTIEGTAATLDGNILIFNEIGEVTVTATYNDESVSRTYSWDGSLITIENGVALHADGTTNTNSTMSTVGFVSCKPSTQIKWGVTGGTLGVLCEYKEDGTCVDYWSATQNPRTISVSANSTKVKASFSTAHLDNAYIYDVTNSEYLWKGDNVES